jgi:hypothetical protein
VKPLTEHLVVLSSFVARHETLLWWVHSLYALAFGIGVMWLGARHYAWLRVTVFYIAFLWLAGLLVPALVDLPDHPTRWRGRARLVLNYFSKNFYQQLLFFLLPVYYASATAWSPNMLFVGFLAVSALVSTLDVFYDRHLSVRRSLAAVFFGFNLFACINVMLPTVWSISNAVAMPASAVLALVAFATIRSRRVRDLRHPHGWVPVASSAVLMALLRLARADFGTALDRRLLVVRAPAVTIEPGWEGRLYVVTAIKAPLGLEDRVGHRWYRNGRLVYASPFYVLVGGRTEGFRLWTHHSFGRLAAGETLRVDTRTESGQLIGRSWIRVAPSALRSADRDPGVSPRAPVRVGGEPAPAGDPRV